jgi:hypothetical protein
MTQETNNLAADLWALADLLRGDFKQSQYGRVILPFALLRRLECVLEGSKSAVLACRPCCETFHGGRWNRNCLLVFEPQPNHQKRP